MKRSNKTRAEQGTKASPSTATVIVSTSLVDRAVKALNEAGQEPIADSLSKARDEATQQRLRDTARMKTTVASILFCVALGAVVWTHIPMMPSDRLSEQRAIFEGSWIWLQARHRNCPPYSPDLDARQIDALIDLKDQTISSELSRALELAKSIRLIAGRYDRGLSIRAQIPINESEAEVMGTIAIMPSIVTTLNQARSNVKKQRDALNPSASVPSATASNPQPLENLNREYDQLGDRLRECAFLKATWTSVGDLEREREALGAVRERFNDLRILEGDYGGLDWVPTQKTIRMVAAGTVIGVLVAFLISALDESPTNRDLGHPGVYQILVFLFATAVLQFLLAFTISLLLSSGWVTILKFGGSQGQGSVVYLLIGIVCGWLAMPSRDWTQRNLGKLLKSIGFK